MTAPSHDTLAELSGLYVLGALEPADRGAFEAHLKTCPECAAEGTSFQPVVEGLARAVPAREPSPELRGRVLAIASAPSQQTPRVALPPRRAVALPAWLATAAALVIAAGLAWQTARLRMEVRTLEARLQEAATRESLAEREIADARRAVSEAGSTVAVLAAPDLARVDLAGQPPAPNARARAFWSRSRGLVFTASGLPTAPVGKAYQLWVVTATAPISAGLLRLDPSGSVTTVIETSPTIPQPTAMAVTIEPEAGVPAPTGDKYLVGTVGN